MFIFASRYSNDEQAWESIISDMKSKGVDMNEDEMETF